MPISPSSLVLTPTWDTKHLTIVGEVAVRETVAVRLVGCAADTSIVVKISSENGRVDYAKFPNAATDSWIVSDDDLICMMSLNTVSLVALFEAYEPLDRLSFVVTVGSRTNANLYAKGCKQIGNWMENVDDPVAYATPLADDIAEVAATVETLLIDFGSHQHGGAASDGAVIPHSYLSGIGTNDHPTIDASLTTLNQSCATNEQNIVEVGARVAALEEALPCTLTTTLFAGVAALGSNATGKQILAKVNEILAILKG